MFLLVCSQESLIQANNCFSKRSESAIYATVQVVMSSFYLFANIPLESSSFVEATLQET